MAAQDERTAGATFALADIGFIDFESRSKTDIKAGTYRYAQDADAIVLAYAIGDVPAAAHVNKDLRGRVLNWEGVPQAIKRHHARVLRGEAVWAAWNAGFDKAIWNYSTVNFPDMQPHHVIDVMAQATASGLAPDLATAAKQCGAPHKLASGKELIKLFCVEGADPCTHPMEWALFLEYARGDIEAMRATFLNTRQLPLAEWREYWAMERINERGVAIDLPMVRAAAQLAAEDRVRAQRELTDITGGAVTSVDQVARIVQWLLPRLPVEGRALLTKREEEKDDDGVLVKPAKFSLTRRQVERLIAMVKADDSVLPEVLRVLQIRLYGGSKTPQKFGRMLDQNVDGVLLGQYVFNGAAQTGRASSRGVQVHNLARDALEYEHEAIEALLAGYSYADFERVGSEEDPVSRKLSLLIRPAFVPASEDRAFVWSDWSQIEARVLPWLADYLPGGKARLQIFREVDADPSIPDLYTRTAAALSHIPIEQVTKPIRQRGKVAELALGFCGGVGALQAMAAGYSLHLSDAEAKQIVERWRAVNPWVADFANDVWEAMRLAMAPNAPDEVKRMGVKVGRHLTLLFKPDYLGGTLFIRLPSGRWLTYRDIRWQKVDVKDDDGNVVDRKLELMFARGYGRVKAWPGLFVENVTQATAADFLRGTLVRLWDAAMYTRLHTHDEVLVETAIVNAEHTAQRLRWIMQQGFGWSGGLPIMSDETIAHFYTKHEGMHGL